MVLAGLCTSKTNVAGVPSYKDTVANFLTKYLKQ